MPCLDHRKTVMREMSRPLASVTRGTTHRSVKTQAALRLLTAGLAIALGCTMPIVASAQLDAVIRNLMQNAVPGAPSGAPAYPPTYRPGYPPSYPTYPAQATSPQYPGYQTYSAPPPGYQPSAPASAAPVFAIPNQAKIAELQRMLNDLGYEVGPADGAPGSRTIQALRSFEREHGQPPSGELSLTAIAAVRSVWYEHSRNPVQRPASDQALARPSFDCARAGTALEREICGNPALAQLDSKTAAAYAATKAGLSPEDQAKATLDQREWLQQRNRCGADASCLEREMTLRLSQLQPQAGTAKEQADVGPEHAVSPPAMPELAAVRDSDAAAAAAIERLSQPEAGLRALKFRMRESLPVFGLDTARSGNEALFFRLVALGVKPSLIEGDDGAENARQFADFLLTRPNRYVGWSGDWAGANEFERDANRSAFLSDYGNNLRDLGPRLPFKFIYAAELTVGRYDPSLGGFPLRGVPNLEGLPFGSLQPLADFKWPELFLPMDQASGERLLDRLAAAARTTNTNNSRAARLAAVIEATGADPGTLELRLSLRRLTLYDEDLKESLYEFPVALVAPRPAQDIVSRLLAPPPGVMPIRLPVFDGRPMLDENSSRFLTLWSLGSIPGLLRERQGVDHETIDQAERLLVEDYLTPDVQNRLLDNPNFTPGNWNGRDEFDRNRSRQSFEQDYLPKLKEFAPKGAFEFAYASATYLPEYDVKRRGFVLGTLKTPGDIANGGRPLMPIALKWSPQFEPPELFWPLDSASAQRMLHQFEMIAARQTAAGKSANYRAVTVVSVLEASRIDPDTGRADLRLKAVDLYTPDLRAKLYGFPPPTAESEPYLSAPLPSRLTVPTPAPLDSVLFDLKIITALGEKTPDSVYEALWQLIQDRDQAYYAQPNRGQGLAPDDVRRPFFPRGGAEQSLSGMSAFRAWSKTYAASLPDTASYSATGMSSEQQDGSRLVQALDRGSVPQAESYAGFVNDNHLQADQLVSTGASFYRGRDTIPILFIVPNQWSLYTLRIPKEALQRHPGATPVSLSIFKLGKARVIRNEAAQPVLAIDLTPLSTKSTIGNDVLASRTYDDIPRLDGLSFAASSQVASFAPGASLTLNATLLDLLAAKAIGERLTPQALSYLIERRWVSENKGITPGGRFFILGKRQPTPEEAAAMAPSFIEWAREHGPAFPARVTLSARVEIGNGQKTAPWRVIQCLGMNLRDANSFDTLRQWVRGEMDSSSRQRAMAAQGLGSWSQQADEKLAALEALNTANESFYVGGGPSGPCGLAPLYLSYQDPAFFSIRILHALPAPSVAALAGKQQLDLRVTLDITSVALSQRPPSLADVLPPELAKALPQFPGSTPTGEFVTFETTFLEARWTDPGGKEVTRLGPYQGETVDSLVKGFRQAQAKEVAAAATPAGPYGPDMVGVQLGMSFEDAERAIRTHMKVGRVLEGRRAFDAAEIGGVTRPLDSGKLFISEGEDELIAILDEPPAAKGRVLAAWRRVLIPAGTADPAEIFGRIEQKYGKPGGIVPPQANVAVSWYRLTGSACTGLYGETHADPISETWFENGRPMVPPLAGVVQSKAPFMPVSLFNPMAERSKMGSECGPFMQVFLQTGMFGKLPDQLDMTLTDIGPYLKAYAGSRSALHGTTPGTSPRDATQRPGAAAAIKF
jgi:uncharacterized protein